MIRVAKGTAPAILTIDGAAQTALDKMAFDKDPASYLSGAKKIRIRRSIYAHASVREQLVSDQHGKCCYCEVKIDHPYQERDVEHWRPKGAVTEGPKLPRLYPGYHWLAFSWENLFLACNVCNRLKKRSRFPLALGSTRARRHTDPLVLESPEILKPDGPEDPEDHIYYVRDVPRAKTPIGSATIRAVGLRRLNDSKRNKVMTRLNEAHSILTFDSTYRAMLGVKLAKEADFLAEFDGRIRKARAELLEAQQPTAPFSAMAKAFIRANPLPV